MSWKKLLESTSESVNEHLRLRHDYLVAENRILRNQIDGRVQLTDSERKELAEILLARPNPVNRNWDRNGIFGKPETIEDLERENTKHGLTKVKVEEVD